MDLTTAFMACVFCLVIFLIGFRMGWNSRCELIRIHVEVEHYDNPDDDGGDIDEQIRRSANNEFDDDDDKPRGRRP